MTSVPWLTLTPEAIILDKTALGLAESVSGEQLAWAILSALADAGEPLRVVEQHQGEIYLDVLYLRSILTVRLTHETTFGITPI